MSLHLGSVKIFVLGRLCFLCGGLAKLLNCMYLAAAGRMEYLSISTGLHLVAVGGGKYLVEVLA